MDVPRTSSHQSCSHERWNSKGIKLWARRANDSEVDYVNIGAIMEWQDKEEQGSCEQDSKETNAKKKIVRHRRLVFSGYRQYFKRFPIRFNQPPREVLTKPSYLPVSRHKLWTTMN
uniref:Uncharacterized protein n=1 Tax=Magallana gigas TaxID=29159 RepID=A0A8W8N561_MAGGI